MGELICHLYGPVLGVAEDSHSWLTDKRCVCVFHPQVEGRMRSGMGEVRYPALIPREKLQCSVASFCLVDNP